MSTFRVIVIIFCFALTSGCASTRMQTPKQHRHMEVSGGLAATPMVDGPDIQVDGMMTLGLFDVADVSAHFGKTRSALYGGMGARLYPAKWLTLSGQFEYRDGHDFGNEASKAVTYRGVLRPSLVFYNHKHGGFYIGPQFVLHHHDARSRDALIKHDLTLLTAGSFLGAEYKLGQWGAIQFEFSISPVYVYAKMASPELDRVLEASAFYGANLGQASVGYTIFFEDLAKAVRVVRARHH